MIDTENRHELTLDDLSRWAQQHGGGEFRYQTTAQPEELFRCALTLTFTKIQVDEFSRVVTFSDANDNRMTLLGVTGASLNEAENCATLTIKCRKDMAVGCKDCYIFKI